MDEHPDARTKALVTIHARVMRNALDDIPQALWAGDWARIESRLLSCEMRIKSIRRVLTIAKNRTLEGDILDLRRNGISMRKIARKLGVGVAVVQRVCRGTL